jgi:limonene-1,2-epoxide hydrolase
MSDKSMDQLRALLKSYEERSAKLQGGVKPVQHEGDQRRRACGERLKGVVRTVLERFMDALKNAGHEAAIEDRTDSADAYPSVTLAFTPRGVATLRSLLVFRYDPRRGIAVARDIKRSPAKGRAVTSSTDRIGTMKVEAVTAEWVETKTLSFIEAVLEAN